MSRNPWYRTAIVAALAVAVAVVLAGKKPATETPAAEESMSVVQPAAEATAPAEPEDAAAEAGGSAAQPAADSASPAKSAAKDANLPRLVDLGAGACIPCKAMAPILEDLKKDQAGTIDVEFIDVWKDPDAGKQYGINTIPTQVFYDAGGKEFYRHEGFFAKDEILAVFKKQGIKPGKSKTTG